MKKDFWKNAILRAYCMLHLCVIGLLLFLFGDFIAKREDGDGDGED